MTSDLFGQDPPAEPAPLKTSDDLVDLLLQCLDAIAALRQDMAAAVLLANRDTNPAPQPGAEAGQGGP